jgi:hypothetical protein
MECKSAPEAERQKDSEWRQQENKQADRSFPNGGSSAKIP